MLVTVTILLSACGPKTTTETNSQTQQQTQQQSGLTQQVALPQQVSFSPPSYRSDSATASKSIPVTNINPPDSGSHPETYTVQSPDGGKYKVTFNPVSSEVQASIAGYPAATAYSSPSQNYVAGVSTYYAPTYNVQTMDQQFHGVKDAPFHGVVKDPSCPNPDIYSPPSCCTAPDQQFHGVR